MQSKNHRQLMTPSQKKAWAIENEKNYIANGPIRQTQQQNSNYYVQLRGNDLINRKYRETYGVSLISREKSQ